MAIGLVVSLAVSRFGFDVSENTGRLLKDNVVVVVVVQSGPLSGLWGPYISGRK